MTVPPASDGTVGTLVSYWYFKTADLEPFGEFPIIADSGAFSAHTLGGQVVLEEYAAWLDRWSHLFAWAFNLDVMFDPAGSFRQWLELRDDYGHPTVPVLHYGDDPTELDPYVAEGADLIGLGGIVLNPAARTLPWAAHVLRYARDKYPDVRFHGLGIAPTSKLAQLPWFSYDSSGWTSAYRFARLTLYDPRRSRWQTIPLDGRALHRHGRLLRETYGVDPSDIAESKAPTRHLLIGAAARAVVLALQHRRRQHPPITPPTASVYRDDLPDGPLAFLVEGHKKHLGRAVDAIAGRPVEPLITQQEEAADA